jgi:hypothetical protein
VVRLLFRHYFNHTTACDRLFRPSVHVHPSRRTLLNHIPACLSGSNTMPFAAESALQSTLTHSHTHTRDLLLVMGWGLCAYGFGWCHIRERLTRAPICAQMSTNYAPLELPFVARGCGRSPALANCFQSNFFASCLVPLLVCIVLTFKSDARKQFPLKTSA